MIMEYNGYDMKDTVMSSLNVRILGKPCQAVRKVARSRHVIDVAM